MNDYLQHTKAAFDSAAGTFDEEDYRNAILQWMRKAAYKVYLDNFKKGDRLLELNSGTGIDAVFLASQDIKVYATDISPKMIGVLETKVKSAALDNMIKYEVKSFDDISQIPEYDFDGVISNFGGLNCISDFTKLAGDLHKKLKPGGKFIAVVINKICLWEIFYYLLKFNSRVALRRLNKKGTDANLNGEKIRTFYFTPKQFAKYFEPHFRTENIYSHGYFTPPPYLVGIYNKLAPVVKMLMKADELTKGLFPFNRFGDHFIIVMNKR